MKIALVAPPFISVPPKVYGGTELFIANLADGLKRKGHEPVVFANGESTIGAELRSYYAQAQWPIQGDIYDNLKDFHHSGWAIKNAARDCQLIHLNNSPGLVCTEFVDLPFVYTLHHPHVPGLSDFYSYYPHVNFVTISEFQRDKEKMPKMHTIHHGIDTSLYSLDLSAKKKHLSFLGRIAPIKGTHLAIQIAKRAGIPLKLAGEVQPLFRDYFEREIKPHIDGKFIEYLGEVDMDGKNELFRTSLALLFPIQWNEPFGLVMVEAMACGVPVLALPGGAVEEVVKHGISGFVGKSPEELAEFAQKLDLDPVLVRQYVQDHFSVETMVQNYLRLYEKVLLGKSVAPQEEVNEHPAAA